MPDQSSMARNVAERQVTMFRLFVGPGLHVTREALSRASGVPASSLKDYAGGAAMPLHVALTLSRFLPAEALALLTEPAGMRLVPIEADETNWDALAAEASGLVTEVCVARSDGVVDHVESAKLRRRVRKLIASCEGAVIGG